MRAASPVALLPLLALGAALAAASCASPAGPAAASSAPRVGEPAPDAASSLPPVRAGAAALVITPEIGGAGPPVRMAGFGPGRDAAGVHDDLYARALVLEAGEDSVALVALDLIGLFHDDVVKIRQEIRNQHPGARIGYVMVASTHTHAGPDTIGLWMPADRSPVDPGYVARVRSQAADAAAEAWERRVPARLSFAGARLPRLIRDGRLPEVIDDLALLMKVETADGRDTIASLAAFADHPESLGRANDRISSDYPGAARRALEDAFGGLAIFVSADLGGLMTPLDAEVPDPETGHASGEGSFRKTDLLGQELARALVAAWGVRDDAGGAGPPVVARARIETRSREFRPPLANPRFQRGLAEGRIAPRALAADGTLTSEAAVVTLLAAPGGGPAAAAPGAAASRAEPLAQFACVPGEIYPELVVGGIQDPQDRAADLPGAGREPALRALMSGRYRFVVGLCNDELGYIIPASQWDEKPPYAYGRDQPQYGEINSAGPRTAPLLLDLFTDLLR